MNKIEKIINNSLDNVHELVKRDEENTKDGNGFLRSQEIVALYNLGLCAICIKNIIKRHGLNNREFKEILTTLKNMI